eukprot:CAMPEP_0168262698 /NCGR_PEP_ID=MMETSP0141_2-20121125/9879_1 /TAXON_ID=44445 /ORGANISM="Pseudo-nitzschia australis, Strain 10249 10 AB" /LENGTH=78 /DNA_ID=CAMNT_0008201187 /DNA_START=55 /DNA_END=288 /DNA_ORIENTATION=+
MTQATFSSKRRSTRPPRTARASPSTRPTPLTVSSNDASVAFKANYANKNNTDNEAIPWDSEPNSRDCGSAIVQNRPSP